MVEFAAYCKGNPNSLDEQDESSVKVDEADKGLHLLFV
jgi:hypothetical protein